ncbi:MAG: hypothetical protein V9G14_04960 [Cypionkella sp.]
MDYSEDYADPNAEVWTYAEAGSPLPKPEGYTGPRSYFDYLQTVQKKGEHGDAFGYKTVNSDAAGWLIATHHGGLGGGLSFKPHLVAYRDRARGVLYGGLHRHPFCRWWF